ncbi:MAG: response regulator [Pirellulales bacterium]|nr:response regulator [Pirellulales bacterium]
MGEPVLILLVEDNPAHAEMIQRGLNNHRIANRIHHVVDGEAALDYLFHRGQYAERAEAPEPHVILLDLRLPKVDGLEVLKQVKTSDRTRRIPVVILTTSDAEKDIAAAYDCRANAYLTKPVDFEVFMQLMRDLGFFWLCWNVITKPPTDEP